MQKYLIIGYIKIMVKYLITKEVYDALLPIYGLSGTHKRCLYRKSDIVGNDAHYFIGELRDYKDAKLRCKYL